MFKLFDPFGVHISNVNDIELTDEEWDIIHDDFLPLTEAKGNPMSMVSMPTINDIVNAVRNRNYLSIYYEDRFGNKGHRLIEPYVVGIGYVANGQVVNQNYYLRAFVIMDSSKDKTTKDRFTKRKSVSVSDKENRWRLFRIDRILRATNLKKKFSKYRRQYNPNDKQLANIIMSLGYNEFPRGENPKINF